MAKASLIATLVDPPSVSAAELSTLPNEVEWLEVRADLVGDLDPEWLRDRFPGRLLYSLRSQAEGGSSSDSLEDRHLRLARAARWYDAVDLESNRDCSVKLLARVPIERRFVSWHGPAIGLPALKTQFDRLISVPALTYRIVTAATTLREEFDSLRLLKSIQRSDTIAYS